MITALALPRVRYVGTYVVLFELFASLHNTSPTVSLGTATYGICTISVNVK